MPSLLERETKRLACVPLGPKKTQMFETGLLDDRTRGGLRCKIKSVDGERDESGPAHVVHMVETQSNDPSAKDNTVDNEALIKLSMMLCIQRRPFTHLLHA